MKNIISQTISSINRQYGEDIAIDANKDIDVEAITTGCYSFDKILGVQGIPLGKIIDLYGMESQGKSTVALHIVASFQKHNKEVAWLDFEQCYSSKYAENLGVDNSRLVLIQPSFGEQGCNILSDLINSGNFSLIVVDSTAAIVSEKEIEKDLGKDTIALQARLIGKTLRVIAAPCAKKNVTVLFISQLRNKVGLYCGSGTIATGGLSLKFYSSIRMRVKTVEKLKDKNGEIVGNKLNIKVEKNKIAKPFGETEVDLYFQKGIDIISDLFDCALKENIITKEGMTYSFDGKKLASGRDATRNYLEENVEVFNKIKDQLINKDNFPAS